MPDVFEGVLGQPQVRAFLRAACAGGRVSHAYLFTGPAGSNKTSAAKAFAKALVCGQGGCNACEACRAVDRGTHPDVHMIAPEGARGYVVSQVRDIVSDVPLAPIKAPRKVYVLDRADLMGVEAANAFLKTLEEPEANVTFVLLARTREAVLPTVVSRCQVVPFRHIPPDEAAGIVLQNTGVTHEQARIAIEACGGSITGAIGFAKSNERLEFRRRVLEVLAALPDSDERDVLEFAVELLELSKAPLDNVVTAKAEELNESRDFLSNAAQRQIEERNKRALSAATAASLAQATAIVRSWLRDVLVTASGAPQLVVNVDARQDIERAALAASPSGLMLALGEADKTDEAIGYNVSPETCFDTLLFTIRKVVHGSSSPR